MRKVSFDDLIVNLPRTYKWEVVLIDALVNLSEKTDLQGIMSFVFSMEEAFKKKKAPDLSRLSLKEASYVTAIFQTKEADFREQLSDFIKRVKSILIQCVLSGMV